MVVELVMMLVVFMEGGQEWDVVMADLVKIIVWVVLLVLDNVVVVCVV
jgi:hypothetical protein